MQYIVYLVLLSIACNAPLWPLFFPREHPRFVAPSVLADIPNVTFRGGII